MYRPFLRAIIAGVAALVALAVPVRAQVATPDVSKELGAVRQVLSTDPMKKALDYVERMQKDPSDLIQDWIGICQAYGPDPDEIYRSRQIYQLFRMYGLENVYIDSQLNVIGIRKGTGGGPTTVLTAHHDNVALWPKEQPIHAFVSDNRVWCPAASDDLVGVVQMLAVLRALNAANIQTKGDLWFVTFTGEERDSRGAHQFVAEHFPINLDWRKGDTLIQFHGGGGEGVTTGSDPIYLETTLHVFTPFAREGTGVPPSIEIRWLPSAVDALAQVLVRIRKEVWDSRTATVGFRDPGMEVKPEPLFINFAKFSGMPIMNAPASEAMVVFDMRSKSAERLEKAHADIMRITREVCAGFRKELPCTFTYEITRKYGVTEGIKGWDKVNNPAARMAAAASQALYNTKPYIDPTQGCGDCLAAYSEGMPMMSLRGRITDFGGGKVELRRGEAPKPEVRIRSTGHDVTQSAEISSVWAVAKHGLVFAVSYSGLGRAEGSTDQR